MKKKLIIFALYSSVIIAMDEPQTGKVFEIPAVANKFYRNTSQEELFAIAPDHLLKDEGIIEALVIRPDKDKRAYMTSCEITPTHIYGDKNSQITEHQDLAVVTMMRADVGQAIGGYHLPGDNIHVSGMRMGKQYLEIGDIITIIDAQNMVKAILLKTYMPHQACWKFQSRCGKQAFDFCNNEDAYENGLVVPQGKLDGVEQRLRGIRLAVLKAGLIFVGDRVVIERGAAKEKRLAEFNLAQKVLEFVEKSKEPGLKYEAEDAARAAARKSARLKKQAQAQSEWASSEINWTDIGKGPAGITIVSTTLHK